MTARATVLALWFTDWCWWCPRCSMSCDWL